MNKKIVPLIAFIFILILGAIGFRNTYAPDYPEGTISDDMVTYAIDTQTIIASLEKGEQDVFLPRPPEPDGAWPIIWPPGSFIWDQEDYLKVADALHQLVWNQPLDEWNLIRADYGIDQCMNIFGRIDSANLSFYQRRQNRNYVHDLWIMPSYGVVKGGNEYSHRSGYTAKWQSIDLHSVKVNSVDAALQVAEENGGREVRARVNNDCRLSILLAPDRTRYGLLSHPFRRSGWGWEIFYWSNRSNRGPGPLFGMVVDPYTGKYQISGPSK